MEFALEADSRRKILSAPQRGPEPESVLRLAFLSDALPTELSPTLSSEVPASMIGAMKKKKKKKQKTKKAETFLPSMTTLPMVGAAK